MMLFKYLAVACLSVFLISNVAEARSGKGKHYGHEMGEMEFKFHPEKMKNLDLTAEQTEQLKSLRKKNKESFKASREEMKKAKKDLHQLMKSSASKEEIEAAYNSLKEKRSAIEKQRFESMLEAREVLTPEQRAKLFDKEK